MDKEENYFYPPWHLKQSSAQPNGFSLAEATVVMILVFFRQSPSRNGYFYWEFPAEQRLHRSNRISKYHGMTKLILKKFCKNKSSSKSWESFQKGIFRVICCLEKNDRDQILVVWRKYLWAPVNIWLQSSVGKDTVGAQSGNKLLNSHGWLSAPARIRADANTTIKWTRSVLSSLPAAALRRPLKFKSWSCFVIHINIF